MVAPAAVVRPAGGLPLARQLNALMWPRSGMLACRWTGRVGERRHSGVSDPSVGSSRSFLRLYDDHDEEEIWNL